MQAKSVLGVAGALVPILYCGSLLFYFVELGGSVDGASSLGLGPTLLGLGVVGMLFCIPLIVKVLRMFGGPRTPGSDGRSSRAEPHVSESSFDADAVVARYMAEQPAQASTGAATALPIRRSGGPKQKGFGRRGR